MQLHVKKVTVSVVDTDTDNSNNKRILQDVSLKAVGGDVIGIMGPSGAGKTTLITYITSGGMGQKGWTIDGDVLLNGESLKGHKYAKRLIGYAAQHDCVHESLTAWQTVKYKGMLRCGKNVSKEELNIRMRELFEKLQITGCKDVPVGGERLNGCSGGQRKKVMVASELITRPPILVLDEPTTGLDANSATVLMEVLREVARANNCIVLISLHQPSSGIFLAMSRVIFMAKSKIVANLEPGEYYDKCEQVGYPVPRGGSVCEHFLDLVQEDKSLEVLMENQHMFTADLHEATPFNTSSLPNSSLHISESGLCMSIVELLEEQRAPRRLWRIYTLMIRHARYRFPDDFSTARLITRAFTIMMGALCWGGRYQHTNISPDFRDHNGLLYLIGIDCLFNAFHTSVGNMQEERDVLKMELNKQMYSEVEIGFARILPDGLSYFAPSAVFLIVDLLAGGYLEYGVLPYIECCVLMFFQVLVAISLSKTCINAFKEQRRGIQLGDVFLSIGNFFAGFYANLSILPSSILWLRYIFPFPLFYSAMATAVVSDITYECNNTMPLYNCPREFRYTSGADALIVDGLYTEFYKSLCIMILMILVYESLAVIVNKYSGVLKV